ncbi:MAG: HAD-IA family hydrolase [Candidatus Dormibacteraeota bacterium]|nr:HAD-IA family hydrolase [Candidatus Dormibacteraeota bacterium]
MRDGERWLTFDCYGTLVDWRHGIEASCELLFPGRGLDLLEAYNRHESLVEAERPRSRYREVLAEAMRRAAADLGLALAPDDAAVLATTLPFWPVFEDVAPALGQLRDEGWHLALLTNCDRDLVALTQRRLPVPFDVAVTAEEVGAYKPDHAHFQRFQEAFGNAAATWIHVAQSYFHDIRPAAARGLSPIWINRLGESDDATLADAVLPDLRRLPETVRSLSAGS